VGFKIYIYLLLLFSTGLEQDLNPASSRTISRVFILSHSSKNASRASSRDALASEMVSPKLETSSSGQRAT
jgi:hypothetical protein